MDQHPWGTGTQRTFANMLNEPLKKKKPKKKSVWIELAKTKGKY